VNTVQQNSEIQIVFLYAAVLGLIFIGLSVRTILARRAHSVALGAGDSDPLLRRIRAHANFAEYVPIALILMAGAVITGAPAWAIHASGLFLIAGRLVHARAIDAGDFRLRIIGMSATLTVIGAASLFILVRLVL
jgi:uncharacterized protein